MPGKDRALVGIELCRDEIRAVYVRIKGAKPEVAAASYARMPEGGMGHGAVAQPPTVAIALKRLLDDMRVPSGVPAVMGIPSEGVTVRTLNVPPAPDEELATIVAGEVEHYRILRSKGSFAFVPLTPPVHGEGPQPISVVVAAAEEQVTRSMGELASKADVDLVALEPTEFGQLRSAVAAIGQSESVFAVLIGEVATDLAVFSKGQLWFYRRIEYGAKNLVADRRQPMPSVLSAFTDDDLVLPEDQPVETQKFTESILDSLCSEISRSVDYLRREYGEHANFPVLHVSANDPLLADIGPHMSERLGIAVDLVAACGGMAVNTDAMRDAAGPDALRYTSAYGLAIRDTLSFSSTLPRVDLYEGERSAVQSQILRRNLTGSMIVSAAAILLGIGGYFLYNRQIVDITAQAATAKDHAKALMTEAQAATEQHQMRSNQLNVLSNDGVPATAITDYVSASLDPGVGVQNLTVSADRTVTMTAEAQDESGMLRTVEALQKVPILQGVMIQTFSSKSDREKGLAFTVVAKTLPLSQVRIVSQIPGGAQ